ncbi:acyl carrier protein [uncultured Bacteroides sp.]|uniref:acyl carrier protein n=1 Tax=uncultured Bacteroides sp. TaxID=162156 RepID=UPI0026088299|nr:acyl carrier protein [uncultured Bacteroides sp.]
MDNVKEKIIGIIADTLEIGVSEINDNSSIGDFPAWDSLGHMNLLQNIQDEFDIELDPEEIIELEDVRDIVKAVEAKLQ